MLPEFHQILLTSTGAKSAQKIESIQSLWSGYGEIARYQLQGGSSPSTVVVKNIILPSRKNHPRGWATDIGHQRKVKSYQVEMAWYDDLARQCDDSCRIPKCYATKTSDNESIIILEDLDESGFPMRKSSLKTKEIYACLRWLANFHGKFLNTRPDGLWEVGTYWHLDTRPDELQVMKHPKLKQAAPHIDKILNECRYKTLVHGDAKVANFCFSTDGLSVAAVDFQYIGGGCGMKDVAYFIGSVLDEEECERREGELLEVYFDVLRSAVMKQHPDVCVDELVGEWTHMFSVAWADFHRFLVGWSPGHWKINCYSEKMVKKVIKELET